jgi:ABC-2 type transport system ATP-binding protein
MIEVRDYHKVYDETVAVSGLTFDVPSGAILGMVGPNGAGKTTTLRAISGIIPPTQGQLRIAGHDVVRQPKLAKGCLAYIPDEPKLFDSLTVWEHIRFIAATYQVEEFEPIGEALIEQFELADKRDSLCSELSRGMRQKVAICCGYLHSPTAILFDEPHTGLDPHAIRKMTESVKERAASGAAVIVSSHLLSLVEDMCSHLLILSKGKSVFCGTLEEARSRYPGIGDDTSLEEIFFHATS